MEITDLTGLTLDVVSRCGSVESFNGKIQVVGHWLKSGVSNSLLVRSLKRYIIVQAGGGPPLYPLGDPCSLGARRLGTFRIGLDQSHLQPPAFHSAIFDRAYLSTYPPTLS